MCQNHSKVLRVCSVEAKNEALYIVRFVQIKNDSQIPLPFLYFGFSHHSDKNDTD
jgi:hypothetical protein